MSAPAGRGAGIPKQELPANTTPAPKPKRVKIDIACNHCRDRKVKCNGVRPACNHCIRRNDRCDYAPSIPSSGLRVEHNRVLTPRHSAFAVPASTPTSTSYERTTRRPSNASTSPVATYHPPLHGLRPTSSIRLEPDNSPTTAPNVFHERRPSISGPSPQSVSGLHGGPSPLSTLSIAASQHGNSSAAADSMTAVLNDGEVSNEYFGSSSVGSFTRQLRAAVSGPASSNVPQSQQTGPGDTASAPSVPRQVSHGLPLNHADTAAALYNLNGRLGSTADNIRQDDEPHDYVLPSRKQADRLVHIYWFYVDGLYPFLDRDIFQASYESLFSGSSAMPVADERVFVSLLNSIFALATELTEGTSSEQRAEASKEYYTRAQQSLRFNVWDGGSLQVVQCLLLMAQYLQSTNHPNQTWMVVGAAIRIAQGLGLHLAETSARLGEVRERELVRRIWHGCILMDRMLAVTHGRPSMISSQTAEAVPQPLMMDVTAIDPSKHDATTGDHGSTDNDERPGKYRYAFFVKTLDLYRIIHRVLKEFYSTSNTNSRGLESHKAEWLETDQGEADAGKAIMTDHELAKWEADLVPVHLHLGALDAVEGKVTDEITRRQIVILRFRCLHTRVLLLRPMLARYCLGQQQQPADPNQPLLSYDRPARQSLSTRVLQQSALVCVETALETVALMRDFLQHDGTLGLLPAWWYRLFYIYTAGAVLMAARLRPKCFPIAQVDAALRETMFILREHEKFGIAAKRCVIALEILSGKIGEKTSGVSTVVSRVGSADGQRRHPDAGIGQQHQPNHTNQEAAAHASGEHLQHGNQQHQNNSMPNGHTTIAPSTGSMIGLPQYENNLNTGGMRHFGLGAVPQSRPSMFQQQMFDVDGGSGSMAADVGLDSLFFDMDDTQWLTYVPADF